MNNNKCNETILKKAIHSQLADIFELYKKTISHMEEQNMHFWDFNVYPSEEDLINDERNGELYCVTDCKKIQSCVALNTIFDEQYKNADWKYQSKKPLSVHRLCVSPEFQGKGIGKATMLAVEEWGKLNGFDSIRLDAFSRNFPSINMYKNLGFRKAGEANWIKGLFYLFEKEL